MQNIGRVNEFLDLRLQNIGRVNEFLDFPVKRATWMSKKILFVFLGEKATLMSNLVFVFPGDLNHIDE